MGFQITMSWPSSQSHLGGGGWDFCNTYLRTSVLSCSLTMRLILSSSCLECSKAIRTGQVHISTHWYRPRTGELQNKTHHQSTFITFGDLDALKKGGRNRMVFFFFLEEMRWRTKALIWLTYINPRYCFLQTLDFFFFSLFLFLWPLFRLYCKYLFCCIHSWIAGRLTGRHREHHIHRYKYLVVKVSH